jgi:hypothetical protein
MYHTVIGQCRCLIFSRVQTMYYDPGDVPYCHQPVQMLDIQQSSVNVLWSWWCTIPSSASADAWYSAEFSQCTMIVVMYHTIFSQCRCLIFNRVQSMYYGPGAVQTIICRCRQIFCILYQCLVFRSLLLISCASELIVLSPYCVGMGRCSLLNIFNWINRTQCLQYFVNLTGKFNPVADTTVISLLISSRDGIPLNKKVLFLVIKFMYWSFELSLYSCYISLGTHFKNNPSVYAAVSVPSGVEGLIFSFNRKKTSPPLKPVPPPPSPVIQWKVFGMRWILPHFPHF